MASIIFFGNEWITSPANKLTLKDVREAFNRHGGFLRPRPISPSQQPAFDIATPSDIVTEGTFDFLNSTANESPPVPGGKEHTIKTEPLPLPKQTEIDPAVKHWAEQEKVLDLLPLLTTAGFVTLDVISTIERNDLESIGITRLGDQKRIMIAKDRCAQSVGQSQESFYPAASAVLASFFNSPTKPAPAVTNPPVTPDTDTQIKIFKDLTKTQAPRRCKSNCHRWKEPRHTCTPADKCPSSEHCGHPDLHPEEKKRKRDQRKEGPPDRENRDTWKKRRKQERNSLLKVQKCPHFDDFYEEEMNRLVAENPRSYSLEKGSDEYALATSLVVQKYKTLKTRLKQEKAVIRQIKLELKGLPATVDQNEYIKKRKAELLIGAGPLILPSVTTTTTTTTTTAPVAPGAAVTILTDGNSSSSLPTTISLPLSSSTNSGAGINHNNHNNGNGPTQLTLANQTTSVITHPQGMTPTVTSLPPPQQPAPVPPVVPPPVSRTESQTV